MELLARLGVMPRRVGVGPRAVAAVIDLLFLGFVAGMPLTVAFGDRSTSTDASGMTMYSWTGGSNVLLLWLALAFGYYIVFEALFGATFGKLILNLRVVHPDGTRIGLGAAIVRNLLRAVDAFPYFLP